MNDVHILRIQALKSLHDIHPIKVLVHKWGPDDFADLALIVHVLELPGQAGRRSLRVTPLVVPEINVAFVLKFLKNVVLHVFFIDFVDEHVDLLHECHYILFTFLGWSNVDRELLERLVELLSGARADPGGETLLLEMRKE